MDQQCNIKVRLKNVDGDYLGFSAAGWLFTPERAQGAVFDYAEDHLADQLALLQQVQGIVLKPEPLEAAEIMETCDRCERMLVLLEMHFDGKQFLCPHCRGSVRTALPPW
jgi:hypothetical protein